MLATEPTESTQPSEATEPMDRIEPAEPIDRIDPLEPIDRIEPDEPMLRIEPDEPAAARAERSLIAMGAILPERCPYGSRRGYAEVSWRLMLAPACCGRGLGK
jgi:hypothetical protein